MNRDVNGDIAGKHSVKSRGGSEVPSPTGTPLCSTDTLFNFDISANILRILYPMDTEDSPWGGM